MQDLLIKIFYDVDNYCIPLEKYCKNYFLSSNKGKTTFISSKTLCLSEIMTITIYFHLSGYRTFKTYYKEHVSTVLKPYFLELVSYNRFVELMQEALIPLLLYMMKFRTGKCTRISFIDSTTLDVCNNRRIYSHKVFKGIAMLQCKVRQTHYFSLIEVIWNKIHSINPLMSPLFCVLFVVKLTINNVKFSNSR